MNRSLLVLAFAFGLCTSARAMQPHATFIDLVSNAHVVLTGRCVQVRSSIDPHRHGIIYSKAYFIDNQVIRLNRDGSTPVGDTLVLNYVGGTIEGITMGTCETPVFKVGEEYLLFLLNDGARYLSPLIGGAQGQYRLSTDALTGERCLLDAVGLGIVRFDESGIEKTGHLVEAVDHRIPRLALNKDQVLSEEDRLPLVTIEEAIVAINSLSYERPTFDDRYNNTLPMPHTPVDTTPGTNVATHSGQQRGTLGACYHQEVYIWFEENGNVPGYDTYGNFSAIEDYGKGIWDFHMNIFSDTPNPTDGFWPDNGECEIAGWLTSSQLSSYYGAGWGTAYAVTFWWASGNEIVEADIAMNAGVNWVDNWGDSFNTPNVNYRNVIVHEFGHAWGYQVGSCHTETYDYDQPSVMHAYYHYLWEDGKEIHHKDAAVIRALYDSQTSVRTVHDLGVESYRASGGSGLQDSSPSAYVVPSGSDVTIYRITVENPGVNAQPYAHLKAYLSTNRSLTSGDPLVGDFALGTLNPVTRVVNAYTLDTDGVPPGDYYLGWKVVPCSYCEDDRQYNNLTWSTFKITVTGNVGIGEIAPTGQLGAYPNPTADLVTIALPEGEANGTLAVIDVGGRVLDQLLIQRTGSRLISLDMRDRAPGYYSVQLVTESGMRYTARIARQ